MRVAARPLLAHAVSAIPVCGRFWMPQSEHWQSALSSAAVVLPRPDLVAVAASQRGSGALTMVESQRLLKVKCVSIGSNCSLAVSFPARLEFRLFRHEFRVLFQHRLDPRLLVRQWALRRSPVCAIDGLSWMSFDWREHLEPSSTGEHVGVS